MATVIRYFCLHFTSVQLSRYVSSYTLFFSKDVVFPAQAEYSYFSADFRLKIFLYYSYIIAYGIFVLFRIYWAINYKCLVSGSGSCSVHCACALDTTFRSGGQDVTSKYTLYIYVWIYENEAKGLISRTILNGHFFLARDYLQRGRYKN